MLVIREFKSKLFITLALVTLIVGCGAGGKDTPSPAEQNKVKYTAQEGLTAKQRFTRALKHLENGQEGRATAELEAYLKDVPGSTTAKRILDQITTDSDKYFPKNYFSLQLKSGESLSTLAKKYLGSALKFYALAKYNDISNPSRVDIGQTIKIPLTQLAKSVKTKGDKALAEANLNVETEVANVGESEVKVEASSEEDLAAIEDNQINEQEQNEVMLDMQKIESDLLNAKPQVTAKSLIANIVSQIESNDYSAAMESVTALKSFGEFDQHSRDLAIIALVGHGNALVGPDNILAAKRFADAGELGLINGDKLAALSHFKKSVKLDANNQRAKDDMLLLQQDITDKYHREASSAYRRQELDVAIAKWDKVLEIDPNHTNAKVYRAQATDLRERLKKLKN